MSRLRKSLLASVYFAFANQFAQLVQVGVYLRFWGADLYGTWLVMNAIPIWMAFSDAGVSSTLGNSLTLDYQAKRFEKASIAFNSAWHCQLKICLALAGGWAFAAALLPVERWLGLNVSHATFAIVSSLMALATVTAQQSTIFSAIYRASGTYHRFVALNANFRLLELVATIAALALSGGFVPVALVFVGVRFANLYACWAGARGLLPEMTFTRRHSSWPEFLKMVPSGLSFLSFSLGGALINQGTALVANHVFGPASVALINTCRQFGRLFLSATSMGFTAVQPELTHAYGSNNMDRGRRLQYRALGAVVYLTPVFLGFGALAGPLILRLWTHGAIEVGALVVVLFSLEACLAAIGNVAIMSAWSMNQNQSIAVTYIVVNFLALVAAAATSAYFGVSAIPIAFAACNLVFIQKSLSASARVAELSRGQLLRGALTTNFWRLR